MWFPYVIKQLGKTKTCRENTAILVCLECGTASFRPLLCKSRLCPECSEKLHAERTARAMDILEPKLKKWKHWSHVVFTIPEPLRIHQWVWEDILALRGTAKRICRKLVGKGGVIAVHTFSSSDPRAIHPHVHCIVYGRKFLQWEKLRDRWAKFLKRRFNYEGEVVVWENWFLKGREKKCIRERKLKNRIKYVLRLPKPDPSVYWHFELLGNHQSYSYFGFKPKITEEDKVRCPICGVPMVCVGIRNSVGRVEWINTQPIDALRIYTRKFPDMWKLIRGGGYGIKIKPKLPKEPYEVPKEQDWRKDWKKVMGTIPPEVLSYA